MKDIENFALYGISCCWGASVFHKLILLYLQDMDPMPLTFLYVGGQQQIYISLNVIVPITV